MNYYINIIDTTDDTHVTAIENASKNAIVLSYEGKDQKDDIDIVGSTLKFNMEVPWNANVDAAFVDLFTGDETKFKVEARKEADDTLIWQGFLLPDSYSEPWKNGALFIDFEAVDGLGRLKGKYLPESYYINEHSVANIIYQCLLLTGLEMPFYLSPGVENYSVKLWHELYIDTTEFLDNDKPLDAYAVLQKLCNDTVSCVYQEFGYWYFVGLNKRNLVNYTAYEYDASGVYVATVELTRNIKEIKNSIIENPIVTIIPPYNTITVTHERVQVALPATIALESKENWAVVTGVVGEVYATDWNGNADTYAVAKEPDYNVSLYNANAVSFDVTKFINLKAKIYLKAGEKITLKLALKIERAYSTQSSTALALIWNTYIKYDILFAGNIIYSNRTGDIADNEVFTFTSEGVSSLSWDFVTETEGLLDIKLYQPYGSNQDTGIRSIQLTQVKLTVIGFNDEYSASNTVTDDYTIDKDVELTFADDASAFSKSFRLAKLKQASETYTTITAPILYGFTQNSNNYSVLSLKDSNLIADNISTVYYGATLLENLEVIYNYQFGEEMVVKTDTLYNTGNFTVRVYAVNDFTTTRTYWEKWSDSVYGIEQLRFCNAVAGVYRRMFAVPHPKADMTVKLPIAFGDIIKWNYIEDANYFVTNTSWNLDSGESQITINKAIYQNDDTIGVGENIPPFVYAGEDIYIVDTATTANLDAEATDPDGFITTYQWEKVSGAAGDVIATPNDEDTALSNLTGDEYEYKITVTDNDGATANDSVKIFRIKDYTVELNLITSADTDEAQLIEHERTYQVVVTPELPEGFTLQLELLYNLQNDNNSEQYLASESEITITKGVGAGSTVLVNVDPDENTETQAIETINYIAGNIIKVIGRLKVEDEDPPFSPSPPIATAEFTFTITAATFINGFGNITNLPETVTHDIEL